MIGDMPRHSTATDRAVAASLDAPLRALPLIAELFAPLTSLGSQPRRVVNWLRAAGIGPRHAVLDLGCGKGAVSVAIARNLGCRVVGVDAFAPFVDAAESLAKRRKVADRCELRCGRIESWRQSRRRFDAVVCLGVWPLRRIAPLAVRLTLPGGVYLVDDAILVDAARARANQAGQITAGQARRLLESFSGRVERELVLTAAQVRKHEAGLYERLRRQAVAMARRDPARRPLLRECLRRQREAAGLMAGPLRPALWLVRRVGRPG